MPIPLIAIAIGIGLGLSVGGAAAANLGCGSSTGSSDGGKKKKDKVDSPGVNPIAEIKDGPIADMYLKGDQATVCGQGGWIKSCTLQGTTPIECSELTRFKLPQGSKLKSCTVTAAEAVIAIAAPDGGAPMSIHRFDAKKEAVGNPLPASVNLEGIQVPLTGPAKIAVNDVQAPAADVPKAVCIAPYGDAAIMPSAFFCFTGSELWARADGAKAVPDRVIIPSAKESRRAAGISVWDDKGKARLGLLGAGGINKDGKQYSAAIDVVDFFQTGNSSLHVLFDGYAALPAGLVADASGGKMVVGLKALDGGKFALGVADVAAKAATPIGLGDGATDISSITYVSGTAYLGDAGDAASGGSIFAVATDGTSVWQISLSDAPVALASGEGFILAATNDEGAGRLKYIDLSAVQYMTQSE